MFACRGSSTRAAQSRSSTPEPIAPGYQRQQVPHSIPDQARRATFTPRCPQFPQTVPHGVRGSGPLGIKLRVPSWCARHAEKGARGFLSSWGKSDASVMPASPLSSACYTSFPATRLDFHIVQYVSRMQRRAGTVSHLFSIACRWFVSEVVCHVYMRQCCNVNTLSGVH